MLILSCPIVHYTYDCDCSPFRSWLTTAVRSGAQHGPGIQELEPMRIKMMMMLLPLPRQHELAFALSHRQTKCLASIQLC